MPRKQSFSLSLALSLAFLTAVFAGSGLALADVNEAKVELTPVVSHAVTPTTTSSLAELDPDRSEPLEAGAASCVQGCYSAYKQCVRVWQYGCEYDLDVCLLEC